MKRFQSVPVAFGRSSLYPVLDVAPEMTRATIIFRRAISRSIFATGRGAYAVVARPKSAAPPALPIAPLPFARRMSKKYASAAKQFAAVAPSDGKTEPEPPDR